MASSSSMIRMRVMASAGMCGCVLLKAAPFVKSRMKTGNVSMSKVTEGMDRTPHRAFMRAMGLDDEDLEKAADRHRQHPRREHAVLDVARAPGRCCPAGRGPGWRCAGAVHDGVGVRWRVDEPQGHAHEPGVARADRRFGGSCHARPLCTTDWWPSPVATRPCPA